jgi:hypothetical protein
VKAVRALVLVLGTAVVVPYLLLAIAFLILGHAIRGGSLLAFFDTLLAHATWIVPWGAIGFVVGLVALAVLGIVPATRRIAAIVLAALATASFVTVVLMDRSSMDAGAFFFLLPCIAVAAASAWIAKTEGDAERERAAVEAEVEI